jgi:diguanylate cyclase (GGDEF)-like protein
MASGESRRRDAVWNPPGRTADVTALFALIAAAPMLLPALGVELEKLAFAIPVAALGYAFARCLAAARRVPARRFLWNVVATAAALGATASVLGLVAGLGGDSASAAYYVGSLASVALLVGTGMLARRELSGTRLDAFVEALILITLIAALSVWFVVVPGVVDGDALLTAIVLIDLVALGLAALVAVGGRGLAHVGGRIALGCGLASAGDSFVALESAGYLGGAEFVAPLLWAAAAAALTAAADGDAPTGKQRERETSRRWIYTRLVFPFAAVAAMPATALALYLADDVDAGALAYFGAFGAALLVLVFGRQAYLLIDNRVALDRQRTLSHQMSRRHRDLEALTGLATTMTQTLEEQPIIERGLGVLHLAARSTSSALHVGGRGGSLALHAVAGAWHDEHPWVEGVEQSVREPVLRTRGGRQIVRLPLVARDNEIGVVTVMRAKDDPVDQEELEQLGLLATQLSIGVQNARDYREKLEQAIRDPLTGVYNRRFFYEALEKEVGRAERYGSPVSVVILDLDDFKSINDQYGHTTGDDALRAVAALTRRLIRPVDSFARLGGEEFGLLLPETRQMDALLVADRVRTAVARQRILPDRRVTLSAGISSCPEDATTSEELGKRADAALYWAKRNGKNICAVASEATATSGHEVRDNTVSHLHAMVAAIDAEPLHTRDHSENVAVYAAGIGQGLGIEGERLARLRRAALFHDIGKVGVARSTLAKPAALNEAEWAEVKTHPQVGGAMLGHAGLHDGARFVGQHHEHFDGNGYPNGLRVEEISLEARIILVADAFEAMTSTRAYREGIDADEALAELRRCSGTQFDPEVVETLCGLVERGQLPMLALRAS